MIRLFREEELLIFSNFLLSNNYFNSIEDVNLFISKLISNSNNKLKNLGELNKKEFKLGFDDILNSNSIEYKERYSSSLANTRYSDTIDILSRNCLHDTNFNLGSEKFVVNVFEFKEPNDLFTKYLDKI